MLYHITPLVASTLNQNTSRSKISSSAFQSGQMRGKDKLSCQQGTILKTDIEKQRNNVAETSANAIISMVIWQIHKHLCRIIVT